MNNPSKLQGGKVWLVGAGPGDPELLTIKAARLISQADALVYDHLVGSGIMDLARADAHVIYAGKESSKHTMPQGDINQLLVELAREGLSVVRLKGGDPFIFGRGGEELETLAASGVPFEVVPGVTAAAGCAAYSGFPLTHREHAQAVTFVTGHLKDGTVNLDWPGLARPNQTVVFYMGIGAAAEICRQMINHGLPSLTPAAVVRNGTQADQQTVLGTLGTLPHRIAESGIKPPALIVVGSVVGLHEKLSWFEKQ
ncbi:uroporphyrinogen-III C-methyltransferase [Dechloromonas sp. XY25]|uniref:uroporphyrinogen-III C-methyltransferase n=1 Tax=Dechloromonas hankyongensis TaxID=2908002 RepID=A0ABS9K714_9RHOO|nr:uroporphyrinogen-III C-methyltransferase [Dechloromonas hankyongensis]MCG2578933.1 uroporphyrinogen-III C-methyltransferase [Dechloromonas hankyongensis]